MAKHGLVKMGVSFFVLVLALAGVVETANAALTLENVRTWYWTSSTRVSSLARGDVDGDGNVEIVTGGAYYDGARDIAQLCVWNGATLALENVRTWYWTSNTYVLSVAVGDVDGDAAVEIVTGGIYDNGLHYIAQLCVWNGATLALENVRTWYWGSETQLLSVAVGNVDGDAQMEIVTGGYYWDGTRDVAQLCVWNGATLALENVRTWYWTDITYIHSVAVGNADADAAVEIVTGGKHSDGTRCVAQLCVWSGATLALENVRTWYWTSCTDVKSVAVGCVDGDAQPEIVTVGTTMGHLYAQLCVWSGASLALENVRTWGSASDLRSVVIANVDGDGQREIVTGGMYDDGTRYNAQLCIWDGPTLALENVKTWYWTGSTEIWSVAVGNVDGDAQTEIVTGGYHDDGTRYNAQLCVWA